MSTQGWCVELLRVCFIKSKVSAAVYQGILEHFLPPSAVPAPAANGASVINQQIDLT